MRDVIVHNISKSYNKDEVHALKDISFEVEQGELFGLIGPDGAGKTSLFRILTTLMLPDSGAAHVNGLNVVKNYKDIRRKIGYMPGKFSLYQDLSVEENLNFFATVFNTTVKENYNLIKDIYEQLEPFKNRRAGKLSGGMKQKLALCCALIHRPTVLFLDEPTTGVDVVSRKEFWEMLKRLKQQGITILVSTPYMDEAALCERIALIESGRIMSIDTPEGIIAEFPGNLYAIKAKSMGKLLNELRENKYVKSCYAFGEYHHITLQEASGRSEADILNDIKNDLQTAGYEKLELTKITPGVEDCFIKLMN